jgi:predicted nucleic acid-binding protein
MKDDKLIYKTDIKLVFDNDCLASFIWIKRIDILVDLYRDRIFVPRVVVDEFSYMKRYSQYSWVYEDVIEAINADLIKVIEIDSEHQAFFEYNKLIKMGKGKGESAAIAIAKTMDNYTACNNLKDIRPFIDNNEINNLLTFDILFEYYYKNSKSIKEIEAIITKMRTKKRKLPDIKFKKYIKDNYRGF